METGAVPKKRHTLVKTTDEKYTIIIWPEHVNRPADDPRIMLACLQNKAYNSFLSRATGMLSCSRYFATVRRAML